MEKTKTRRVVPKKATSLSVQNPEAKLLHRIQKETNGILMRVYSKNVRSENYLRKRL
jgi:hypothetical protein